MVTALPLRRLVFSPTRGVASLPRSPVSLNRPPGYWRWASVNVNNRFIPPPKSIAAMHSRSLIACLVFVVTAMPAAAEDGYDLWLRYRAVDAAVYPTLATSASELVGNRASPTLAAAGSELERGLSGMLGKAIPAVAKSSQPGAIVYGTPRSSTVIAGLSLPLDRAGVDGYVIRSVQVNEKPVTVIAANSDIGVLYGAFHFLRLAQTRQKLDSLDIVSRPRT